MKILVVGHSGSEGGSLADPSAAWRHLLPRDLQKRTGLSCELAHEKVYSHVPGSAERTEMLVDRHQPDVVIIPLTTQQFTVRYVSLRVRKLAGHRIGGLWERAGGRLDACTRHRGRILRTINSYARSLAHRLIGGAPSTSYEAGLESYLEILRRLAQREHLEVLLLGATPHAGVVRRENRHEAAEIDRFHRDIREACNRLHFVFVDKTAALKATGNYEGTFYPDGIHNNELGHRIMADVLLAAFDDEGQVRRG